MTEFLESHQRPFIYHQVHSGDANEITPQRRLLLDPLHNPNDPTLEPDDLSQDCPALFIFREESRLISPNLAIERRVLAMQQFAYSCYCVRSIC